MNQPPPPPQNQDRRRYTRYDDLIFASMRIAGREDLVVLTVQNVSLGGIAVTGDAAALATFPIGSSHDLLIFDAGDPDVESLSVQGLVVRSDAKGVAFMWDGEDPAIRGPLSRLIEHLRRPR